MNNKKHRQWFPGSNNYVIIENIYGKYTCSFYSQIFAFQDKKHELEFK